MDKTAQLCWAIHYMLANIQNKNICIVILIYSSLKGQRARQKVVKAGFYHIGSDVNSGKKFISYESS